MTINERRSLPIWKKIIVGIITLVLLVFNVLVLITLGIFLVNAERALYSSLLGLVVLGFIAFAALMSFYISKREISANYKLIWVFLIMLLPIIFIPLYILNGTSRNYSKKKKAKIHAEMDKYRLEYEDISDLHPAERSIIKVMQDGSYVPTYRNTKYIFFNDALDKFNDMLIEFENAEHYILIESFIIRKGYLMDEVIKVLEKKGKEGVKIYILYDSVGSLGIENSVVKKLAEIPNCQVNDYEPLGVNINLLVNYRDHRKITVIDGVISYCGGDNFSDEYIHKKERFGFWRDNCGKYIGEATRSFVYLFAEMWYVSTGNSLALDYNPVFEIKDIDYTEGKRNVVIPFGDGPSNDKETAYDLFMMLFLSAHHYIYISTPYLIVDDAMVSLLCLKASSGIDVRILMPGIPDKKAPYYMAQSSYKRLIKSGCKIYEFTKGFNHAKNILVDSKYAFIGTVNMDYRSLFLHYECGCVIMHDDEIVTMEKDFVTTCIESKNYTLEDCKKQKWYKKFIAYVLSIFSPFF